MRKCSRCMEHHLESNFRPEPRNGDGLRSWCKTCDAIVKGNAIKRSASILAEIGEFKFVTTFINQGLFRAKVDSSGECWLWTGFVSKVGYGALTVKNIRFLAHRVSYLLDVGEIKSGLFLDHLCRNTKCVRPSHLEPVTNAENLRRGNSAILSKGDIPAIKNLYRAGARKAEIARRYGMSFSAIKQIIDGSSWRGI